MEALHTLGIDFKLLLAQAVNFGVLLTVLSLVLYRPVLRALEERRQRIADSLKKAEEIEQRSKTSQEEFKKQMEEARLAASRIVEEAKAASEALKKDMAAQAEAQAAAIEKAAHERMAAERAALYADVQKGAAKLALFLLVKVLKLNQNEAFFKENVERALKEIDA